MAAIDRTILFPQSRFELQIPGYAIGNFTSVTGLSAQVDVMEYAEGGLNDRVHKLPTRVKHTNLVVKHGMTNQPNLLAWFKNTVVDAKQVDLSLSLYDSEGNRVQTWSFAGAYPVKWTGPDMNASGTEIATESLEIAHNGVTAAD
jgi:phage tail-like protein